jgi:hypothetical protein
MYIYICRDVCMYIHTYTLFSFHIKTILYRLTSYLHNRIHKIYNKQRCKHIYICIYIDRVYIYINTRNPNFYNSKGLRFIPQIKVCCIEYKSKTLDARSKQKSMVDYGGGVMVCDGQGEREGEEEVSWGFFLSRVLCV